MRRAQVEHELDVGLRQDAFARVLRKAVHFPENFDVRRQVRGRGQQEKRPVADARRIEADFLDAAHYGC
jgi:hypothetical protein